MRDLLSRMLQGMKDRDLVALSSSVHNEQRRRAEKRIKEGRFARPTEEEETLLKTKGRLMTMKAYRDRTNCPLVMAQMVVDLMVAEGMPFRPLEDKGEELELPPDGPSPFSPGEKTGLEEPLTTEEGHEGVPL